MKNQIVVSLLPSARYTDKEGPLRAFYWISVEGEEIGDMLVRLQKQALQHMNFSMADVELMNSNVQKAYDSKYKVLSFDFNMYELMTIAILDEAEMAAREAEINQLMGMVYPKETVH